MLHKLKVFIVLLLFSFIGSFLIAPQATHAFISSAALVPLIKTLTSVVKAGDKALGKSLDGGFKSVGDGISDMTEELGDSLTDTASQFSYDQERSMIIANNNADALMRSRVDQENEKMVRKEKTNYSPESIDASGCVLTSAETYKTLALRNEQVAAQEIKEISGSVISGEDERIPDIQGGEDEFIYALHNKYIKSDNPNLKKIYNSFNGSGSLVAPNLTDQQVNEIIVEKSLVMIGAPPARPKSGKPEDVAQYNKEVELRKLATDTLTSIAKKNFSNDRKASNQIIEDEIVELVRQEKDVLEGEGLYQLIRRLNRLQLDNLRVNYSLLREVERNNVLISHILVKEK